MIRINLLPVRQQRKKQALIQYAVLAAAGLVALLAICFFLWVGVKRDISKLEAQNRSLETDIENFKRIIGEIEVFEKKIEERRRKKEVIERLRKNRQGPVRVLDELASRIPKKVWMTELTRQGTRISVKGGALSQRDIANFMLTLEESPYFQGVKLDQISKSEDREVEEAYQTFQLVATVTMPADKPPAETEPDGKGKPGGDKDGPADAGGAR